MDDLERLRGELGQLRQELTEQRRWSAETQRRSRIFWDETVRAVTESLQLIKAAREQLAKLRSKDQA